MSEPTTTQEALADVHHRYCVTDAHDPVCRLLREGLAQAWEEGYRCDWTGGVKFANPYKGGVQ